MNSEITTTTMDIWPGLAPGETTSQAGRISEDNSSSVTRLIDVTRPQLLLHRPSNLPLSTICPAVLVLPGGGYSLLATDLEGSEAAQWLNAQRIAAAVLHYRLPGKREAAYQDGQRALSLLRTKAAQFGIDPGRLGVIGFSAGGHLAARLASGGGERTYPVTDEADHNSCLPNFALLIYPAYLVSTLTGIPVPEVQPHPSMPPMFLVQTEDDPLLSAPAYAAALTAVGVSTCCILYETGGHGYGLRAPVSQPVRRWSDEASCWLQQFQ